METQIIQLSQTRFQVGYPGFPPLTIDFAGVLAEAQRQFPDANNLLLKHWQARPPGQRRWGVFCWKNGNGSYCSYWPFEIKRSDLLHMEIQIPDGGIPPTAVLCYPNAILVKERDQPTLYSILEDTNG